MVLVLGPRLLFGWCAVGWYIHIYLVLKLIENWYKSGISLAHGFFGWVFWDRWIGNHSQKEWAKFGYGSERKVYIFFSESCNVLQLQKKKSSKCDDFGTI